MPEQRDPFLEQFNRMYVKAADGSDILHTWKDGMKRWQELPSNFRSLTFSVALADWRKQHA